MLESIAHILQHNCGLDREKPLLLGVSGGPDSLCLLHVLHRSGYEPVVAHLNHGLRPSADDEEQRLKCTVEKLGLGFASKKVDVYPFARENRMSVEEGAREARYRFLFEQAGKLRAQSVVVGHNADDQVETVLMHLLRGAGLAGLRGMEYRSLPNAWSAEIPLVRPLLSTWRDEILAYLAELGLPFETDETNADPSYFRNRLRHELIPYLKGYNPEFPQVINRMAELLRGEYKVVEKAVEAARLECQFIHGNGYVRMSTSSWKRQMTAIQRSLIREAMASLKPGLRDMDYAVVERAVNFLSTHTTGGLDLISGIVLLLEPEHFYLLRGDVELPVEDWPQVEPASEYWLSLPGECRFPNGWVLRSHLIDNAEKIFQSVTGNFDPYQAFLDLNKITAPLMIRSRNEGDWVQVLGMEGRSAKVSDLMINAKIPKRARHLWPVVLSGQEIAWVPGIRTGDSFRVTLETRQIACLELVREQTQEGHML